MIQAFCFYLGPLIFIVDCVNCDRILTIYLSLCGTKGCLKLGIFHKMLNYAKDEICHFIAQIYPVIFASFC